MQKRTYDFYFNLIRDNFFKEEVNKILLLKGRWGSGKTFLVKDICSNSEDFIYKKTVYISLTGVQDLDALKRKIALARKKEFLGNDIAQVLDESSLISSATSKVLDKLSEKIAEKDPYGIFGGLLESKDLIMDFFTKDINIILDDLERMNFDKLSLEEFLGYVLELKEEKNCKVLILCNEKKILDKSTSFSVYKEKFIDFEIEYNIDKDYIFGKSLGSSALDLMIVSIFEEIECNNFRLVIKIIEIIKNIFEDRYDNFVEKDNKVKRPIEEFFFVFTVIYLSYFKAEGFISLNTLKDNETYFKMTHSAENRSSFSSEIINEHEHLRKMAPYWAWDFDCDIILNYIQEGCFVINDIDMILRQRLINETDFNDKLDLQDSVIKFMSNFQSFEEDMSSLDKIIFDYYHEGEIKKNYPGSIKFLVEILQTIEIESYVALSVEIENSFFEKNIKEKNIIDVVKMNNSDLTEGLMVRIVDKIKNDLPEKITDLIDLYNTDLDPSDMYNPFSLIFLYKDAIIEKIEGKTDDCFVEFFNEKGLFFMVQYVNKNHWNKLESILRDKFIVYLKNRKFSKFDEFKIKSFSHKAYNIIKNPRVIEDQ